MQYTRLQQCRKKFGIGVVNICGGPRKEVVSTNMYIICAISAVYLRPEQQQQNKNNMTTTLKEQTNNEIKNIYFTHKSYDNYKGKVKC